MAPRKIAAGNWKMNGDIAALTEVEALMRDHPNPGCDMLICPTAVLIHSMAALLTDSNIAVGAQNCHHAVSGAHTGDISAVQLRDAGASHVITGHSERRTDHNESDQDVREKSAAAHQAGLTAIICLGETEAQRDAGDTLSVIEAQLAASVPDSATAENCVVAYEPIWAIGTGRTPTTEQIAEVHALLREKLAARFADGDDFSLLYGGSVKPGNAAEIFAIPHVNGALVGGASLKASDFGPIAEALGAA